MFALLTAVTRVDMYRYNIQLTHTYGVINCPIVGTPKPRRKRKHLQTPLISRFFHRVEEEDSEPSRVPTVHADRKERSADEMVDG